MCVSMCVCMCVEGLGLRDWFKGNGIKDVSQVLGPEGLAFRFRAWERRIPEETK